MDGAPVTPVFAGFARAGELVDMSADTIKRAVASGHLTPYRPAPGRTLVKVDELLAWVESGKGRAPVRGRKSVG